MTFVLSRFIFLRGFGGQDVEREHYEGGKKEAVCLFRLKHNRGRPASSFFGLLA